YQLSDKSISTIPQSCYNLEEFHFHGSKSITNQTINESGRSCPKLRCLTISSCPNITDLKAIAHSCQNLEYFDVFGYSISDESICDIIYHCQKLKYLNISGCQITKLGIYSDSNIEHLDISTCNFIPESVINESIRFYFKLQHLNLGYCNISNETIRKMICSCLNLKFLDLEGCENISEELVKWLDPSIHIENYDSTEDPPPLIPTFTDILNENRFISEFINHITLNSNTEFPALQTRLERSNLLNSLIRATHHSWQGL
ncbi:2065_t:CDS:2, partial [Diversispora eburnea]